MALTEFDFARGGGLDITGLATVAAGDLNNLIDLAEPVVESSGTEGKGLVIWTVDSAVGVPVVPSVATTSKWKRYLWKRVPHADDTATVPFVYTWNDNATAIATYAKWQRITADTTAVEALIAATQAEVDLVEIDVAAANSLAVSANDTASNASLVALSAQTTADIANGNALTALSDLDTTTTGVKDRVTAVETRSITNASNITSLQSQIVTINNTIGSGLGPVFIAPVAIATTTAGGSIAWTSSGVVVPTSAKAALLQLDVTGGIVGTGLKTISLRASSVLSEYIGLKSAGYTGVMAWCPVTSGAFDYKIDESSPPGGFIGSIQLIGYVL